MKRFLFPMILLFTMPVLFGQNTDLLDKSFAKYGEVYFKFKPDSPKDIAEITKIISIDNYKNDTVYAYASQKEFDKFLSLNLAYDVMPAPSEGINPKMTGVGNLKSMEVWDSYPTYDAYITMMNNFAANYPTICQLYNIGTTVQGRQLLAVKISDNVGTDEAEPEFFYTSSMHGDETTGYVMMLRLIDSLLTQYGINPRITNLVDNMEIFINPLANPDGTYHGGNNTVTGSIRYNANYIDLNRNYPDPVNGQHPDGNAWQPETVAFMNFAEAHHFVMSANFHGGSEVCNYPWDTKPSLPADANWWIYISNHFADTAQYYSPSGYFTNPYSSGITNGYAWYEVDGGRQDYMNYFHQCREETIEISTTKNPNGSLLPAYWGYLRRSLLNYMEESLYGLTGMVTDANTGQPLVAEVYVLNHEADSSWVYSSPAGDYHRLLIAGTYSIRFSAPCHINQTINNVVVQNGTATVLNIQLEPDGNSADFTASSTNISVGETVTFTDLSCGNPTSWLWTITGPGTVIYMSGTSNASQNPVVQFNSAGAYSVMLAVSGPLGSNSLTKENYIEVTDCTVSSFPWSEGFENAGNMPDCWTQEYVSNTLDWTYQNGGHSGHPNSAHSGSYNAFLYNANTTSRVTKLITPQINLSVLINPVLTFWHTQALWLQDQDELRIYYKTSLSGTWTLLQTYTSNITAWTLESINLPNPSSEYYIAFQGTAKYGYGVCLDDITVNGTVISPPVAGFSASTTSPLVGETVIFTDQSTNEPTSWTWTFTPSIVTYMGGTNTNSQNPQVQFNEPVNYTVELVATNSAGSDSEIKTDYITVQSPDFELNLKVMLEGPFNGFSMNTDLAGLTDFPMTQPYQSAPWNYLGTESVSAVPPDVVDWILVELRDAVDAESATAATRIARQAAFVLSDGSVVGMDGSSNLIFSNVISNQLFVVVWHRNHLGIMSAAALVKAGNMYSYDFTANADQAYGTNAQIFLSGGIYGMTGGDSNADGIISDADKNAAWSLEAGFSGYLTSDLNLDGQSDNTDKNDIWQNNVGKSAQVP